MLQNADLFILHMVAARSHHSSERWMDVYACTPFGVGLFLQAEAPTRIKKSDILRVVDIPQIYYCRCLSDSAASLDHSPCAKYDIFDDSTSTLGADGEPDILEVSPDAYSQFLALRDKQSKKLESLWKKLCSRRR